MRQVKFFVGSEQVANNSIQHVGRDSWAKWGVAGVAFPGKRMSDSVAVSYSSSLVSGTRQIARAINYNPNGSKHQCDARCLNAKGGNCECSCGGANHGAGHA